MSNKSSFRFDNTLKIKQEAKYIQLPNAPMGNDIISFEVGEKVLSTGLGTIKQGVMITVEQVDMCNGYARYYGSGVWNRQSDIMKIK